jgi:hypothetical protein
MERWLSETINEIREKLTPSDEGSLWLLFFDEPLHEPLIASAFDDAMAHVDAQMTRNIAQIIDGAPADAVLVAVPRRDGVPRPVDRRFWQELRTLLDDVSPRLLDLVVVGDARHWSAQESDGDLGSAA